MSRTIASEVMTKTTAYHDARRSPNRAPGSRSPAIGEVVVHQPALRTYPTPRTVWSSLGSKSRSIFSRSRETSTSTTLVPGSKL